MDPASGAETGVAKYQYCTQGDQADDIEDGRLVEDQVIVEAGKGEHDDEAKSEPANLFVVHAFEAAAGMSGRIDFEYTKGADGHEDGNQPPVVIARILGSVLHGSFRFPSEELVCAVPGSSSLTATAGATTAVAFAGLE